MIDKALTPSTIVRYLDQFVIGQDDAKKVMAVAVYSHYRKIEQSKQDTVEISKSNVLLIGPSGTGKTLMCETLARVLKVPFVTADATSLAQSRYVNEEIEAILQRLVDKADGDIQRAQNGIVFIDEIDKLKAPAGQARSVSGESVQHALLKITEGAPVKLQNNQYIDTSNTLFICGGAFVGLEEIMSKTHGYGYISTSGDDNKNILDRLNTRVKPTDLFQYGLIPEFTGRLPIVASFQDLTRPLLVRILTEPKNSIYNQFRQIFKNEGVELDIQRKVFEQIAEIAFEYKTGARSLRGIFEEMITPILYIVPDRPEVKKVVIDSLFTEPAFVPAA
ncbi:MAG: ATP-dependent Clp protease ATP-binding subunit ClpX [Betaproteobacteria bacterium]|nr:ATP-dependent Clp protease ATP-binding subunit ClpX [Betaproteobacteria bacterium]